MAVLSRGGSRRIGLQRARKSFEWRGVSLLVEPVNIGATEGDKLVLDAAGQSDLSNPTVTRVRGRLEVQVASLTGASYWSAGICLVEERAALAGIFPQPISDIDNGIWLWWGTGLLTDYGSGHRYERREVDAKAKRRMPIGMNLYFVFQNSSSSSAVINYYYSGRVLFQEV